MTFVIFRMKYDDRLEWLEVRLQTEPKNLTPFDFCAVRVVTSTHSDCPMSLDAPMIYLKYQHQSHHLATWESASDPNTRFDSILQFQSQQSSKKKEIPNDQHADNYSYCLVQQIEYKWLANSEMS